LQIIFDRVFKLVVVCALFTGRTCHLPGEPAPFVLQRALPDFHVEHELYASMESPVQRR